MEKSLLEFSSNLRILMQKSELATNFAIESFDYLNKCVRLHQENLTKIFNGIDLIELREKNLILASTELEAFLTMLDLIERDRLEIMHGPRGSLPKYISSLEQIKLLEKYTWIKENSSKFANNRVELCYYKFKKLIMHGEKILLNEFQNLTKHYSANEQLFPFIDFIINSDIDIENTDSSIEDTASKIANRIHSEDSSYKSKIIEMSEDSFMPKETLVNLEQITWW